MNITLLLIKYEDEDFNLKVRLHPSRTIDSVPWRARKAWAKLLAETINSVNQDVSNLSNMLFFYLFQSAFLQSPALGR